MTDDGCGPGTDPGCREPRNVAGRVAFAKRLKASVWSGKPGKDFIESHADFILGRLIIRGMSD
jgi:hypothetical protein